MQAAGLARESLDLPPLCHSHTEGPLALVCLGAGAPGWLLQCTELLTQRNVPQLARVIVCHRKSCRLLTAPWNHHYITKKCGKGWVKLLSFLQTAFWSCIILRQYQQVWLLQCKRKHKPSLPTLVCRSGSKHVIHCLYRRSLRNGFWTVVISVKQPICNWKVWIYLRGVTCYKRFCF